MSLTPQITEAVRSGVHPNVPEGARILIVCDDDAESQLLTVLLRDAGFDVETAIRITTACEAVRSGQFQVVVSAPELIDGSWRRLVDVAQHFDLKFEVVLWARLFDLHQWSEALNQGAFDVLDAVYDRARIAEVAKCALWAAYLRGARINPKPVWLPGQVA